MLIRDYKKYAFGSDKESIGPKDVIVLLLFEQQHTKFFLRVKKK